MLRSTLRSLVDTLLRRAWLVAAMTVVVCAGLAARAVAALTDAAYLGPAPHAPRPAVPAPAPSPPRVTGDGAAFVARNMFCSTCPPPLPGLPGTSPIAVHARPAVLIATSIGASPVDTRATVRVLGTEVQGSWGVGETIPGVGQVERIGWVSIDVLDDGGQRVTLSLRDSTAAGRSDADAATSAPAPAADPRIRQLGEDRYEVDRELVRELVSGAAKPGAVRMTPIVKDGEVQGVRVLGARAGSVPAAIGLRSGDTLSAIDGTPIRTAQQLLDLYAKLDQLSTVELQGTRAGKPLAITLQLR